MFLKEIDFLSPPISLYYQGSSSHSSIGSGILSIITILLIIYISIVRIKKLFTRENETLNSNSFTYFVKDAGIIPINSSSLFHFINIENFNNKGNQEFDFTYFNAIGVEDFITSIEINTNINDYNHWLYGLCNENDISGIEDIVTQNFLTKSACLKKYFDTETQRYYDTSDPNFRWPSLSHGKLHPDNKYYTVMINHAINNF